MLPVSGTKNPNSGQRSICRSQCSNSVVIKNKFCNNSKLCYVDGGSGSDALPRSYCDSVKNHHSFDDDDVHHCDLVISDYRTPTPTTMRFNCNILLSFIICIISSSLSWSSSRNCYRNFAPNTTKRSTLCCVLLLVISLLPTSLSLSASATTSSSSSWNSHESNQLELMFSVSEGVPVGTFVGVIKSNNDTVPVEPPFLIVPIGDGDLTPQSPPYTAFVADTLSQRSSGAGTVDTDLNIDQSTGEIRTAIELDREQRSHYSFIAISLTGVNVYVKIVIEDVNDNVPRFPTDQIELEFPENSKARDVKRTLPPAIDLDRGLFGTQTYRIVSGNVGNAFRLASHREKDDILYLDLQVNGVLDRETIAAYTLVIEALDGGQPPLKDQLTVKITILDHNDCEPIFTQSHYYGTVAENVTLGTSLLKVTATDSDQGENGQIVYLLHSKQSQHGGASWAPSTYFAVHRHTGWIYVAKPLDFESRELHELVVIARDQGSQPLETSALVSIRVTDVNDNQPAINLLFLTATSKPEIFEDAKVGDLVARVSVNDGSGSGDNSNMPPGATLTGSTSKRNSISSARRRSTVNVELLGADTGEFGLRTVDHIVYLIVVTGPLDREHRAKYSLTVVVTSDQTTASPSLNTNTTFELEVLDVNDNAPQFSHDTYRTTLPEAADIGTSVFQCSATDRDSDSYLMYAFLVKKNDISATWSFDLDLSSEHRVRSANTIATTDHNETHQLTSQTSWFSIDRRSGLIVTRTQVDCETDPEPRLTVIVTDYPTTNGASTTTTNSFSDTTGFSAITTIIVSISDINDNEPIFDQSFYNVTVREDDPPGTCILQVSATDADCGLNALVNYSFAFDDDIERTYQQQVKYYQQQSLLVGHHGGNNASPPPPSSSSSRTFYHQDFTLDPNTGRLCIGKVLDYEQTPVYDIPVLATDRGGLSTTAMIKVQVIDTNDNYPVFYPREYKVSVQENTLPPERTPLVIVAATDQDSSQNRYGQIRYTLKSGNEKGYFEIDSKSGEIFLLKPLSAKPGSSSATQYRLTVSATDGGGLEAHDPALVLLSVLPADSESSIGTPVFVQRQFNFQVIENVAQGAIVGTVQATIDRSSSSSSSLISNELSYAIYSGDPVGYFTIDPRQGTISVKSATIDREQHSYLLLNVQAYSGTYPGPYRYAHTQVNITILDENDNVPRFPSTSLKISVPENVPVSANSTVFVAYAVDYDADQFGSVRYSLYSATPATDDSMNLENSVENNFPFVINEHSGQVHLKSPLDYEARNEYQLRVVAIDGGQLSSEMLVTIIVQDVNDNPPLFVGTVLTVEDHHQWTGLVGIDHHRSLPLYRISVAENAPVNTHFYQIKATDLDTGNNGRLTYSLFTVSQLNSTTIASTKQSRSIPIDIFPNNGILYIKDALDRESVPQYEMVVVVADHGTPTVLNTSAILQITVLDVNDNRPYWIQPSYTFSVSEDSSLGTLVGQVTAFDADLDSNATLVYSLGENMDSTAFRVDPSSGQIYLRSTLDRELKDRYELVVDVHDQGQPKPLYSEEKCVVTVLVLDVNDNRPVFENIDEDESGTITVPLGTSRKSTVAKVKAYDPDAGENGTVQYSLVGNSDLFAIDSESGAVITRMDIKDGHKDATHSISVLASDGRGKKSKVKQFNIQIVDKRTLNIDLDNVEVYNFALAASDANYGYRVGTVDLPEKLIIQHQCANRLFTNFYYQSKQNVPFFVDTDGSEPNRVTVFVLDQVSADEHSLLLCVDWEQCLVSILNSNDVASNSHKYYSHHRQLVQCDHYVKINIRVQSPDASLCTPLPVDTVHSRDMYEVKIPWSDSNSVSGNSQTSSRKINELLYLNQTVSQCDQHAFQYEISSPLMNDDALSRMFTINGETLQFRPQDKSLIHRYLHEDFVLSLAAKRVDDGTVVQSVPIRVKILSSDNHIGNIAFTNEKYLELEEDCCQIGSAIVQARINVSHDDFRVKYFLASYGDQHLVSSDEQFTLNADSGLLYLKRVLDFERKHEHRVNITAVVYDSKSPIISVSHIVNIRIINTNDEAPVFQRESYEKEVPENAIPGTVLLQLEAKDSDQLLQSNITYVLPTSYQYAHFFELGHRDGVLKLSHPLDRETIEQFNIPVYAFDEDFKHHSFMLVHIKVLDINDNQPFFVQSSFDLKIPESVRPGTVIYNLMAIDPDLVSGQYRGDGLATTSTGLQYRILSGNVGNKFVLHGQRGELSTNDQLDREMQPVYNLVIEVSDSFYQSVCNVTIELVDVNDNAPIFDKSDYYAILNDVSYGWLNVVTVRAIDSDGDKLLYSIDAQPSDTIPSSNLTRYFSMNSETGEITIHSSLLRPLFDAAQTTVFTFEVVAVEAGKIAYQSHISKAKVHVTLVDSNGSGSSSGTIFDNIKLAKYPYVMIVDEPRQNIQIGHKIGTIELKSSLEQYQSSDSSKQSKQYSSLYNYRVINGGESYRSFNDYFTIQPQTGIIVTKRTLKHTYYEALVEVSSNFDAQSTISTTTLVQIFIGGIDERKFVRPVTVESVRVAESLPVQSEVINLGSYLNHGNNKNHQRHQWSSSPSYNFVLMYSDIDYRYFELNVRSGVIRLRKQLDYESLPSEIELIVLAYQPSGSIQEAAFVYNITIELTNVDDNQPQFTQKHYIATIAEGEHTGTFVAQVNAIDIDEIFNQSYSILVNNRRYSYYIVDGNVDNAFSVTPSGQIRTNIVLDREIQDRYYLKIIATEVKADFGFNNDQWMSGSFLSDEANYQHLTQCIVEVIVIDQNDNEPVFPPYKEISVSEDAQVGSVVATWTANDVDIYPTLTYSKRTKTASNDIDTLADDLFDIGLFNGKIYLKSPLRALMNDRHQMTENDLMRTVHLQISASDQLHSVDTELAIIVKRNHTNMAPIFTDGANFYRKFNLDEDYSSLIYETNVELFRVTLVDTAWSKERKVVFRLNTEAGTDGFYIDQHRGVIYNNRTMRFRATRLFNLAVYARFSDSHIESQASLVFNFERGLVFSVGSGGLVSSSSSGSSNHYYYHTNSKKGKDNYSGSSATATVNLNQNSYTLEIDGSQIGVPLLRLARRMYENYVIVGGNTNKNFVILRGNELVLVSTPLTDQYSLKVKTVPDPKKGHHNSSTSFVHIKIRPPSSNPAQTGADSASVNPFKSAIFEIEISESVTVGTEIQSLKSVFGGTQYRFEIFSGNELDSFRVEQRSGVLSVKNKLDFETNAAYRLGVLALSDQSTTYFAIVNVNLINANEYCPQFPLTHFKALIEENSPPGTRVLRIKAIDQDQDHLNYTVIKLNDNSNDVPFYYDVQSGYLVTRGQLDYEHKSLSSFKFIVRASDASGATNSDAGSNTVSVNNVANGLFSNIADVQCSPVETVVEVQVGSMDEFSPQFGNDSYDFKLTATITRSRVKVGQVSAEDSDSGPDGLVTYSIKSISPSSLSELVRINATSGVISMSTYSANLPRQFSMIVSASSGRVNSLNSLAMVNVRLLLVDDGGDLEDMAEVINTIDQGLSVTSTSSKEASLPGWIIFLTVLLLLITVVLMVSIVVIRMHQAQQQNFLSGHMRTLAGHNVGSLFRKIGPFGDGAADPNVSPAYSVAHYGTTVAPPAPPCYNDVTLSSSSNALINQEGHSASSGRGSADDDADLDDVDEEIRMINESSNYYTEGPDSCEEVTTTAEYLARLGVSNHYEEEQENTSSIAVDDDDDESMDVLSDMAKINQSQQQRYGGLKKLRSRVPSVSASTIGTNRSSGGGPSGGADQWPSLNSIVHNEEELSGSYNWDYLQHWGPKYQPMSSVFAEIARLKSVANSTHSTISDHGGNSVGGSNHYQTADIVENMSQRSASTTSSRARTLQQQQQQQQQHQFQQQTQQQSIQNSLLMGQTLPPPPAHPYQANFHHSQYSHFQQPITLNTVPETVNNYHPIYGQSMIDPNGHHSAVNGGGGGGGCGGGGSSASSSIYHQHR